MGETLCEVRSGCIDGTDLLRAIGSTYRPPGRNRLDKGLAQFTRRLNGRTSCCSGRDDEWHNFVTSAKGQSILAADPVEGWHGNIQIRWITPAGNAQALAATSLVQHKGGTSGS